MNSLFFFGKNAGLFLRCSYRKKNLCGSSSELAFFVRAATSCTHLLYKENHATIAWFSLYNKTAVAKRRLFYYNYIDCLGTSISYRTCRG